MHLESTHAVSQAPPTDRFVDDQEAAALLSLSRTYMRQLRLTGDGPRFAKFGRAVRYRVSDVFAWADKRTATSTSQLGAA